MAELLELSFLFAFDDEPSFFPPLLDKLLLVSLDPLEDELIFLPLRRLLRDLLLRLGRLGASGHSSSALSDELNPKKPPLLEDEPLTFFPPENDDFFEPEPTFFDEPGPDFLEPDPTFLLQNESV